VCPVPPEELTPAEVRLEEEIEKFFGSLSSKTVGVTELLRSLDLEPIADFVKRAYKNVWHSQHDPVAIARLLVYRELRGIKSPGTLAKHCKRNAAALGIDKVPGRRTLRSCCSREVEELVKWAAEKIREVAERYGVRLLCEEQSRKGKPSREEVRKICKLAEKHVFSVLKISSDYHNSKYSNEDMLNLLLHAALSSDFAENASKTLRESRPSWSVPDADTLLYHIKYHTKYGERKKERTKEEVERMFIKAFDAIFKMAKRQNPKLFEGKKDVAIDFTDWLFYGKPDTQMVVGTKPTRGTHRAYKFGTICIVENGVRFTLLALPVENEDGREEEMVRVVEKLLEYATKKIKINRVYADRWFYKTEIVNILRKFGLDFVIQAAKTPWVKRVVEENKDRLPVVVEHTLKRNRPPYMKESIKLFIVRSDRSEDGVACFATNLDVDEKSAERYAELFKRRWGIETSYRVENNFRPKTTSKSPVVRLFYFMFSVCIYNLWVIANVILSLASAAVSEKPIITAKMFIIAMQTDLAEKPPP